MLIHKHFDFVLSKVCAAHPKPHFYRRTPPLGKHYEGYRKPY